MAPTVKVGSQGMARYFGGCQGCSDPNLDLEVIKLELCNWTSLRLCRKCLIRFREEVNGLCWKEDMASI